MPFIREYARSIFHALSLFESFISISDSGWQGVVRVNASQRRTEKAGHGLFNPLGRIDIYTLQPD